MTQGTLCVKQKGISEGKSVVVVAAAPLVVDPTSEAQLFRWFWLLSNKSFLFWGGKLYAFLFSSSKSCQPSVPLL